MILNDGFIVDVAVILVVKNFYTFEGMMRIIWYADVTLGPSR